MVRFSYSKILLAKNYRKVQSQQILVSVLEIVAMRRRSQGNSQYHLEISNSGLLDEFWGLLDFLYE
jgi:hypothetical protein